MDDVEQAVVAVVADVLGKGPVDVSANFFDLGGDSLDALEVINRLMEDLSRDVPLDVLFDAPDLAAFATAITALPILDA